MADFQAVLFSEDEMSKDSEEEVYKARDDMETDARTTEHSHQSPLQQQEDEPKP